MVSTKNRSSAKPQTSSRSGKDKVSLTQEYGNGLVGSRVRVWWPLDRKFYEGVVKSYASSQKKHRVLYDDGDEERLDMKKERWELIEEEDVDAEADEISLQDESGDKSADGTPESLEKKNGRRNEKSSENGRMGEEKAKKKQKIETSVKSKANGSGKKPEDSDEEKPKRGGKEAEDEEKETQKLETEKNGKMGNIGGKIVAAASRMSGRFRSKENGQVKEVVKAVKTSKKAAESNRRNLKRPSSSSGVASDKGKQARTFSKRNNSNPDDEEVADEEETADEEPKPRALRSSKKVSESKNPRQGRSSSSSEERLKKPKTSLKKIKSNSCEEEEGDGEAKDKAMKFSKKGTESNIPKQKRTAVSGKEKKPRTSSKIENGDEKKQSDSSDEENHEEVEEDSSDDEKDEEAEENGPDDEKREEAEEVGSDEESKPLMSFLKKTPEGREASMDKLKGKKEKEGGEDSSGNETEGGEEA